MKFREHFLTITQHKLLVMKYCFAVGLYWQGLIHDFSKYSPVEFWIGIKYFQGDRSPNNAEREAHGFSSAWLHHKGRNKHHQEYWIDYAGKGNPTLIGMKMPLRFVIEMFFDRIAACRTYQKDAYTQKSPLIYYLRTQGVHYMHPESEKILEGLLLRLARHGEKNALAYVRQLIWRDRQARLRLFLGRSDGWIGKITSSVTSFWPQKKAAKKNKIS